MVSPAAQCSWAFFLLVWYSVPREPGVGHSVSVLQCASHDDWRCARSMHEFSAKDIDGHMICLDKYKGFVCIVTNVASQ